MGARNMRREVVPTHDSVSALSAHVFEKFVSIANIELGNCALASILRKCSIISAE